MANELTYDQHPPDRELGPTVLVVDDELESHDRLKLVLADVEDSDRIHVLHASSIADAIKILTGTMVHVVLLDKNLGPEPVCPEQNGIEAIPEFRQLQPHLQILMVTGSREISDIVRAMTLGAFGYIAKDMPNSLLVTHINRAVDMALLTLDRARRERSPAEMGGKSRAFQEVLRQAEILAESNRPVLILGPTGTGKTELAKWIHRRRGRFLKQKERPFFAINVSTLSKDLIESELFGHEQGAFTDARSMKQGIFELANNGTLLLDEIGELPYELQAKLLTVIEKGRFFRVGGQREFRSNPKMIFATNRDLEAMVTEGKFREDLYMRISMFPIRMPSLSERKEDIPEIVQRLLPKACRENGIQVSFEELPSDFIEHLIQSPIDGNVRGVQHQLERLIVYSPRDKHGRPVFTRWKSVPGLYLRSRRESVRAEPTAVAPLTYRELRDRPWDVLGPEFPGMGELLDEVRTKLIQEALNKFKTNRMVARILRVSESTASLLVRRYNIDRKQSSSACALPTNGAEADGKELIQ